MENRAVTIKMNTLIPTLRRKIDKIDHFFGFMGTILRLEYTTKSHGGNIFS